MDGGVKLRPAIAFQAAEHIAGQAFAVQPHQRRLAVRLADQQRDMLARRMGRAEGDDLGIFRARDGQARTGGDGQRR